MAMSISPPSFLIRVVLLMFKIATALFSHTFRSILQLPFGLLSCLCRGSPNRWVPSALRKGLSVICGVGKEVTAEATRRRSLSLDFS